MRWHSFIRNLGLAAAIALPAVARGGPATEYGLFNTGVNDLQVVLKDNDLDTHYELIEPSHVLGSPIVATSEGGFPIGPWIDDNHLSTWITPSVDTNGPGDVDGAPSYVYRTTFDLTGVVLANLEINGLWSTDNQGLDILLNGESLAYTNTAQFGAFTPFILDTGFVNGVNTLDFVLNNGSGEADTPGPTGLRVQFDGNGGDAPPPPPPHPYAIKSLYATGVDNNRVPLEGDNVVDPHYTIVAGPNGEAMDAVTVPNDGFPIPPWFGNNTRSRWISPPDILDGHDANGEPGTYAYQTTFNMSGVDLNNAAIVIGRGTDDAGPTVLLNGVEIPTGPSRGFGERSWVAMNSASVKEAGAEFKPGDNTLTFIVENGGEEVNPTGMRVDNLYARAAPLGTVPIPGLYNTGVDDQHLPIEDFEPEIHYEMSVFPPDTVEPATALGGPPVPPWAEQSGSSRWIGPDNSPAGEGPPGDYEYTIDFDLSGLDPASAVIMGMWSADNTGSEILLNGTSTGNAQNGSFPILSPFEISIAEGDSFLPGINTLTFRVNNAPPGNNPTGLRVDGLVAFARQGVAGDFNANGVLDANDIDLLSAAARSGANEVRFDVNSDNLVNNDDRLVWINTLANTYVGDSNLDREFNSGDFVLVFQSGQYEDGVPNNSLWATGDWNGDTEFDSSDFVAAFQAGGFELGPRAGVAAVPEPSSWLLCALAIGALIGRRRCGGSAQ